MLTSGDVVEFDLGTPSGREAGFRHPAIVVTAQRVLDALPSVIQIVPLTSTVRGFASEVEVAPDGFQRGDGRVCGAVPTDPSRGGQSN